jgi:hypothetical protein
MKNYKMTIGTESRIIRGINLKDAKLTAQMIKFYGNLKGKTSVSFMSATEVFNHYNSAK